MESDKLISVFEMLVERLTNIELQNATIINHLKETCVKNGLLEKKLFGYPLDVKLIQGTPFDGTPFDGRMPRYVLVSFPKQRYDKEPLRLCLFKDDHVEKIKNILDDTLTQSQMARVLEYIEYLKATPEKEVKPLPCEELGIKSIYINFPDYILNQYFLKINSKLRFVITSGKFLSFIIQSVTNVDEIWSMVNNVLGFWDFTIKQRYIVDDCMHVNAYEDDIVNFLKNNEHVQKNIFD